MVLLWRRLIAPGALCAGGQHCVRFLLLASEKSSANASKNECSKCGGGGDSFRNDFFCPGAWTCC